jgi:hypothetical protein
MKNVHVLQEKIYITSDEEIKEGDWCYFKEDNSITKTKTKLYGMLANSFKTDKKIILTTDQDLIDDGVQAIDDEFLEWFVKNPTYEEVYIIKQCKQVNQDNPITRGSTALMFSHYEIHLLKATKQMIDEWNLIYCKLNNRQIPTKEEPKQDEIDFIANELDIEKQRSYSEQDMKKAFYYGYCCENKYGIEVTFNDWFVKFKNK